MASKQIGIVVGIDKINGAKTYRVIAATVTPKGSNMYDWVFNCRMLTEQQVIQALNTGVSWLNIKLDGGTIKGSSGALSRFEDSESKPFVIISQLTDTNGRLLGYKVADYNGNVKNITIKEMIAYGNRATKTNKIPVQNAIFVPEDAGKKAHYKSYPNCSFINEVMPVGKNKYARKPTKVPLSKNEKTLSKLEEIYSLEQIAELREGKKNGVDIRIYANPALSSLQMNALRKGLEKGVNVKPFASPDYDHMAMKWYINDAKAGINIKSYLNPNYTIGQLSEISLAAEEGLDLSILADINKSPDEMAEIRERLEAKIWKDELVKKDGSWK